MLEQPIEPELRETTLRWLRTVESQTSTSSLVQALRKHQMQPSRGDQLDAIALSHDGRAWTVLIPESEWTRGAIDPRHDAATCIDNQGKAYSVYGASLHYEKQLWLRPTTRLLVPEGHQTDQLPLPFDGEAWQNTLGGSESHDDQWCLRINGQVTRFDLRHVRIEFDSNPSTIRGNWLSIEAEDSTGPRDRIRKVAVDVGRYGGLFVADSSGTNEFLGATPRGLDAEIVLNATGRRHPHIDSILRISSQILIRRQMRWIVQRLLDADRSPVEPHRVSIECQGWRGSAETLLSNPEGEAWHPFLERFGLWPTTRSAPEPGTKIGEISPAPPLNGTPLFLWQCASCDGFLVAAEPEPFPTFRLGTFRLPPLDVKLNKRLNKTRRRWHRAIEVGKLCICVNHLDENGYIRRYELLAENEEDARHIHPFFEYGWRSFLEDADDA